MDRALMALHLQEELEAQGVRIGGKRGVNLSKLTDAAMTAVRSTDTGGRSMTDAEAREWGSYT